MKRVRLSKGVTEGGSYFASPKTEYDFINTGCTLLDCSLGGGWPLGRVSNVVGDKSTGKTLLAIEGIVNFAIAYPKGKIFYRESESAFSNSYAKGLGMPVERVDFGGKGEFFTVEAVFRDLEKQLDVLQKKGTEGLYVLDSLDALSDEAELTRDMGQASYGTGKAKAMSEMFRRIVQKIEASKMHFMIISQVRDNIGATFGRKYKRSGGHALDFYASHVVYLSHIKTIKRTLHGVKRPVSVLIKAKCDKNKISLPFRECQFEIQFAFGIDDLSACVDWLEEVGRLDAIDLTKAKVDDFILDAEKDDDLYRQRCTEVAAATKKVWYEIEQSFLPKRRKYG